MSSLTLDFVFKGDYKASRGRSFCLRVDKETAELARRSSWQCNATLLRQTGGESWQCGPDIGDAGRLSVFPLGNEGARLHYAYDGNGWAFGIGRQMQNNKADVEGGEL
jgi:hypothetical protein